MQNHDEMVAFAKERKKGNPTLYKAASDEHRGAMLARDIKEQQRRLEVFAGPGRHSILNDLPAVHEQVMSYFDACAAAEAFPSVMGLAKSLGLTRRALEKYIAERGTESAQYLEGVKDSIADVLVNASLYNLANPVQAIFQLKNHFDHADTHVIEARPALPLGETMTKEDIARAVAELPDYDED